MDDNNIDTNTVIIDFTNNYNNNNNNNNNLNSFVTIDPENIDNASGEQDHYRNVADFQTFITNDIFEENDVSKFEPKINNITTNPIKLLDAIAKSQMQNIIFKFAEDIIGALGFKTMKVFKSDKYDTIKKAIDNLSKIDPEKYITGTTMIIDNTGGGGGGGPPPGAGGGPQPGAGGQPPGAQTGPKGGAVAPLKINADDVRLSNIPKNIQEDLQKTNTLFGFEDSTEYLNNIIFLRNLQKDKLERQKIFFDFHMEIYEKLHFYFNARFTANLSIILDQIKNAVSSNLEIDFEDNKQMFAELIKSEYYNSFVSYCRDHFKLNVFAYNIKHVYDKKVLINNLKIQLLNILNKINNNVNNNKPPVITNTQTDDFFNNL